MFVLFELSRNQPVQSTSSSPSQQHGVLGDSEDYVADSEDEATKNFKGRVCSQRAVRNLELCLFM